MSNNDYVFKEEFLQSLPTEQEMELGSEEKTNNPRSEGCLKFVFIQTIAFTVIVICALLIKTVAPKSYTQIKTGYSAAISRQDITLDDIKSVFLKIYDFIFYTDNKQNTPSSSNLSSSTPKTETESSQIPISEEGTGGKDTTQNSSVSQDNYVLTTKICAPTKGSVTSNFGRRIHPITKKEGFHTGIDIASKEGTPIYAAFSGRVYEIGKNEAYGNYVIMRHSDNLYTFYGHLKSIKAAENMQLRAGETIAYMGSTGYSTGPHLHFEIRINSVRVDPKKALEGIENIEF